ncbi:MAG: DNA helicase, partial [Pseudomonadota bacterium]|nr:DNA helicase [Pseudomonadota bacterium]
MPTGNHVTLVPYRDDILQVAAERITHRCAAALPDLADCVVLLPELHFAPQLRWQLLQSARSKGYPALLGPVVSTLEHWLSERFPVTREIPGRARRELMLVAALQQHRAVFPGIDPWHIANDLIALFDELTLNRITLPGDIETFTRQLGKAYGVSGRLPEPLGMEAAIVHRLWQAWHEQLDMEDLLDPGMAYLQRLAAARSDRSEQTLFLVGFSAFTSAEMEWVSDLLPGNRAELILRAPSLLAAGDTPDPIQTLLERIDARPAAPRTRDTAAQCLEAVFRSGAEPPAQRASEFSRRVPQSPLSGRLAILAANTAEQEAQAIDLQVRQWLLAGHQPIGIVTEDRRLARRVRALLERAAIGLQDSGGWALSTTSAAAALESWLETVEEDFAHQPLLDVLKSAFIFPDEERTDRLSTVHRLEQDIILHENIARGLARYRRHIGYRLKRLPTSWSKHTAMALQDLLNRLDQAAAPLREFIGREPAAPSHLLEGLRASLEKLGMWAAFDADPAGRRILNEWDLLYQAARHSGLTLTWPEFRAWLGTALERHDFHPATGDS